jgi:integrase
MSVFARGSKLWIRFRDVGGKWRNASTGYSVGEEALAQAVLDDIVARVAATERAGNSPQVVTVRSFAEAWLAKRETETAADDRGRIHNHILPALGNIPLGELRPRQVREFVQALTKKKRQGNRRKDGSLVPTDELLAPRTVRHVYGTLRAMLNDAVADEVIPSSPCVLKDELPAKRDKDRTWRRTAVFTRDEVEAIISAESTPDDRRVLASLMFLGAMRFGEAAALTWRDYDATCTPLGKLVIEKSYSTKKRKVKGTKTENPREMPVHPMLARILAEWKLSGFERLTGRQPRPEDPIVPSRRGAYRNVNASLRRFHEDLDRIGLRARRQHDARRTFISIARADGAVADTLHFATHGPDGEIMDDYTTLPWPALCAEVAKVRISLREGKLLEMPARVAVGAESSLVTAFVTVQASSCNDKGKLAERTGLEPSSVGATRRMKTATSHDHAWLPSELVLTSPGRSPFISTFWATVAQGR